MSISSSVSGLHAVADRCTRVHTAIIHALKCSALHSDVTLLESRINLQDFYVGNMSWEIKGMSERDPSRN